MEVENDPDLTEEQLLLVNKLSEIELNEIDNALLSNISGQWRKLARVVGTTMQSIENRIKGIPDVFYAQRIKHLVNKGIIESQGNLNSMHFSEVKKREKT